MEYLNLQLVLLIIGVLVILFVLWDSKRRKITDREPLDDVTPDEVEEIYNQRDDSGYDILGVGLSRIITTEDGLVASRDDTVDVGDESLTASRDDAEPTDTNDAPRQPDLIIALTILAKDAPSFCMNV